MDLRTILLSGVVAAVAVRTVQHLTRDVQRYIEPSGRALSVNEDLDIMFGQLQSLRELMNEERGAPAAAERYDFSVRWGTLLAGTLARLALLHDAGRYSAEQAGRYASLCRELRDALPLIDQAGVVRPSVALGATGPSMDQQIRGGESC